MTEVATPIDLIDPPPEDKPRRRKANGKALAVATAGGGHMMVPVHDDPFLTLLERFARDPEIDPGRIQQILGMKREEEDRRARRSFLAAFAKMQAELPAVERKGTGQSSKFARFEDFIRTIKPHLSTNGFSLSFRIASENSMLRITGVLGHVDGHQESTDLPLPADTGGNKNNVQAWGSTISYGKRYVGMTLLGIATENEDDDGNKAGAEETITDNQVKRLQDLIKDTNSNAVKFLRYISSRAGRDVPALTDIPASQFDHAVEALEAKQRAGI